ncbi:MAG: hypothetical protein OXI95_09140 [bacterium]|nr:hypothetical protein [bacterium]
MLRDIVEILRSPAPLHLGPMGYLRELAGIARRAEECREEWRPHLERTRQVIEHAALGCRQRESVLVTGSGLLLDVPVEMLARTFRRVILVDIHHGRSTRRAVRRLANVELVALDVTGVARACYRFSRTGCHGHLPEGHPPAIGDAPFDLAVSVNLMSQLAVMPRRYVLGHCPAFPPERLKMFTRELISSHIDWLARHGDRVCLITDVERHEDHTDGRAVVVDLLEGVRLGEPDETWTWLIAPEGKVFHDRSVRHRVAAWRDYPSASR